MHQRMWFWPIGGLIVFLISSLAGIASPIDEENTEDTTMLSLPISTETSNLKPDQALKLLAAGNAKVLGEGSEAADDIPVLSTDADRFPSATIFYAAGASAPTKLIGLDEGDIYQVPLRGGVFTAEEMDDLEYGIVNLKTPVAVVLTDYPNRDVLYVVNNYDDLKAKAEEEMKKAKAGGGPEENTVPTSDDTYLYTLLGPAVARAKSAYPDKPNEELASLVSETVAWQSLEAILTQSDAAVQLIKSGDLKIIAAMVDDSDGRIYWLGEHPFQSEFVKDMPNEIKEKREKVVNNKTEETIDAPSAEKMPEEITEPLTQEQVDTVITEYKVCREEVIQPCTVCYVNPPVYVPSWELFYPGVWYYRPWYGCGVYAYAPWPYYDPWYYGYAPYVPVYRRWGFCWGVAVGIGIGLHIDAAFHPWDPYWDRPIFRDPIHHPGWHPGGPHDELWHGPHHPGPGGPGGPHHPGPGGPGGPGHHPGGPEGPHHPGGGPGDWHPGAMKPDAGGKVPGRDGISVHPGKGTTDHPGGGPAGEKRPGVGGKPHSGNPTGISGRPAGKEGGHGSSGKPASASGRESGHPSSASASGRESGHPSSASASGRESGRPSSGGASGRTGSRSGSGSMSGREGGRSSVGNANGRLNIGTENGRNSAGFGTSGMGNRGVGAGPEGTGLREAHSGSAGIGIREGARPGSTGIGIREGARPGSTGIGIREGARPGVSEMRGPIGGSPRPAGSGFSGPRPGMGGRIGGIGGGGPRPGAPH